MNILYDVLFYLLFVGIPVGIYYYKKRTKRLAIYAGIMLVAFSLVYYFPYLWSIGAYLIGLIVTLVSAFQKNIDRYYEKAQKKQELIRTSLDGVTNTLALKSLNDSDGEFNNTSFLLIYSTSGLAFLTSPLNETYDTKYEIKEIVITKNIDKEIKKKWLGRAIVGNFILPGAGAVVGALTAKEKEVIKNDNSTALLVLKNKSNDSLRKVIIKLTESNEATLQNLPTVPIEEEITETSHDDNALSENEKMNAIKEYKKMFDEGILTEAEFASKKEQLLN